MKEDEVNEQNLRRSAAKYSKIQNFGVGAKWDSSVGEVMKPGARTPSATSVAKSE